MRELSDIKKYVYSPDHGHPYAIDFLRDDDNHMPNGEAEDLEERGEYRYIFQVKDYSWQLTNGYKDAWEKLKKSLDVDDEQLKEIRNLLNDADMSSNIETDNTTIAQAE